MAYQAHLAGTRPPHRWALLLCLVAAAYVRRRVSFKPCDGAWAEPYPYFATCDSSPLLERVEIRRTRTTIPHRPQGLVGFCISEVSVKQLVVVMDYQQVMLTGIGFLPQRSLYVSV